MAPVIEMKGIGKRFLGVAALEGVDFDLSSGEVHALTGENRVGKSTLIKTMMGVHLSGVGTIHMQDGPVLPRTPDEAVRRGVRTLYQEVNLAPNLSVMEKLLLGRMPADEVEALFDVVRRLRDEGLGIVLVTYFLDQVYALSDRITVLRNGQKAGTWAAELSRTGLVFHMIGRDVAGQGRPDDDVSRLPPCRRRRVGGTADGLRPGRLRGRGQRRLGAPDGPTRRTYPRADGRPEWLLRRAGRCAIRPLHVARQRDHLSEHPELLVDTDRDRPVASRFSSRPKTIESAARRTA